MNNDETYKMHVEMAAHARKTMKGIRDQRKRTHQTLTFSLRKEALEGLMEIAEERGITRIDLVREILIEYAKTHRRKKTGRGWRS
jgi:hypothetical protein